MAKPTKLPEFASSTVTLPLAGTTNKIEPDATLKSQGFDFLTIPEAQEENWWRNNVYEWVKEINEQGVLSWDSATVYPIGAFVKGSDNNLYRAIVSQSGNDPVSDGGTNWVDYQVNNNFTPIAPTIVYSSSTATEDVNIDLTTYIPNGGEVFLSFWWDNSSAGDGTESWAGLAPTDLIPTWDQTIHSEMSVSRIDSASRVWDGAGNLCKVTSTGLLRLHREGGAHTLYIRITGYRAWS